MSKTHTIKVDEKRNGDGSMTYGATVTEHHADGDFSSFYRSRNLNAAHAMANEKRALLQSGMDDYLTKPFSMVELMARIRAVLRRIRPGLADDRLNHGDIVVDRVSHRVKRAGQEVHLGPTEFRLLDHFMQHPGRVFSREQLLDAVWGSDVYVEARTVDVHVGRLRKALNLGDSPNPIRTVRSAGYSLDLEG